MAHYISHIAGVGFFIPYLNSCFFTLILRTRSGGFLLLPARCVYGVYGLPARERPLLEPTMAVRPRLAVPTLLVLAKRRSTLRAGTESPGVPVAGNQSARSKRLAIQDRMISKSSNKPTEPKAKQTDGATKVKKASSSSSSSSSSFPSTRLAP